MGILSINFNTVDKSMSILVDNIKPEGEVSSMEFYRTDESSPWEMYINHFPQERDGTFTRVSVYAATAAVKAISRVAMRHLDDISTMQQPSFRKYRRIAEKLSEDKPVAEATLKEMALEFDFLEKARNASHGTYSDARLKWNLMGGDPGLKFVKKALDG